MSLAAAVTLHSIARWANYARRRADHGAADLRECAGERAGGGICERAAGELGATGAPCTYTLAMPASQIAVNRNELQVRSVEGDLWNQTDVTARFKVLGVRNDFDGGVEGGQEISNPVRTSYTIKTGSLSLNSVPSTNLASPNATDVFSGQGTSLRSRIRSRSRWVCSLWIRCIWGGCLS